MDAFVDPTIKRVVVMSSAQVAKTTIIENVIGYHIHHDPAPIMIVQPTLEIAEAFSKDRLAPMLRDTPALRGKIAPEGSKSSGNTLLHKKFHGGHATISGANSYNSLASRPVRLALGDEAAKWKNNEQGSPFKQVAKRTTAFWNKKEGYFSTPTGFETEFQKIWDESDKRLFEIPCPACGEMIVLTFMDGSEYLPTEADVKRANLYWKEGKPIRTEDGREIRRADDAWFQCECGARISDNERHRAVKEGQWQATQSFYGTAGFWLWQGYSPFSSAVQIANEWLTALGITSELQSVKNETLGLPWKTSGEAADWKKIYDRVDRSYKIGTVPDGALILTAGADVQPDRIEIQVIGWGRRRQAWLVDYLILEGDTSRSEIWQDLNKILGTIYENRHGAEFRIRKFVIDSGYGAQHVYRWARQHRFNRVVSIVRGGPDSQTALIGAATAVDLNVNGRKMPAGVKVHTINVGQFKSEIYSRLALALPNQGENFPEAFFHVCESRDTEEYCRQLTSEQLVTTTDKRTGRQNTIWQKMRARNEALDTWDYGAAGRELLGISRYSDRQWDELERAARRGRFEAELPTEPVVEEVGQEPEMQAEPERPAEPQPTMQTQKPIARVNRNRVFGRFSF